MLFSPFALDPEKGWCQMDPAAAAASAAAGADPNFWDLCRACEMDLEME